MGKSKSLLSQTLQTFVSMFGVLFINMFSAVILSHGLTPEDRGLYLGVTMWSGLILGICDVGIYLTTVYMWGKCKDEERKDIFMTLLVWAIGTGIVCGGVAIALGEAAINSRLSEPERVMASFYYLSTVVGPLTSMISGICAAEMRFGTVNLVRIGVPAVLTSMWLIYHLTGVLSVSMCLLTTAVIPFSAVLPLLWQVRSQFRRMGRFRRSLFRGMFWYGLRGHGGSLMNVVGNSGSQILVFALTPSALAFFQTASSATGIIYAIPLAIGLTSFPDMVREDASLLHERLFRFFRLTLASTLAGILALGAAEPFLIPFLFGREYVTAILPAIILLPSALCGGLSNLVGNGLSSTGRTLHNTVADAVNVGATLGCMALTIHSWGIIGAAVSTLTGTLMSLAVRLVWYYYSVRRFALKDMLPNARDLRELVRIGLDVLMRAYRARRGKLSVQSR